MKHAALLIPLLLLALKTGSVVDYRFAINETMYLPPHGITSFSVTGVLEFRVIHVNSTAVEARALLRDVHVHVARAPGDNNAFARQIESEIIALNNTISNHTVILGGSECIFTPILRFLGGVEIAYYCDPSFLLNELPEKLMNLTRQGMRVDVKSFKEGDNIVLRVKAVGERSIGAGSPNATHANIEVELSIDAVYSAMGLLRHAKLYYRVGGAAGFTETRTSIELETGNAIVAMESGKQNIMFSPLLVAYAALAAIAAGVAVAVVAARSR